MFDDEYVRRREGENSFTCSCFSLLHYVTSSQPRMIFFLSPKRENKGGGRKEEKQSVRESAAKTRYQWFVFLSLNNNLFSLSLLRSSLTSLEK